MADRAQITPLLRLPAAGRPRVAIFLSGSGSNAEQILQRAQQTGSQTPFVVTTLVTDAPETSRARELGKLYGLPVVENDIREFYRAHGETRVSVVTARGQEVREKWTAKLREQLRSCSIDFGVFAGFVPLSNIAGDFPCLNVHPGDLTYLKEGRRYLVGLHTVPIERAILESLPVLRSSIIVARPYSGRGDDMDSGLVLGISAPVPVDLQGEDVHSLRSCAARRPAQRPPGGFGDRLEQVAKLNQENLKRHGDWVVFPAVVLDFARGLFGADNCGQLHFRLQDKWHPVEMLVYGAGEREIVFKK
jgi:hypothetical protein